MSATSRINRSVSSQPQTGVGDRLPEHRARRVAPLDEKALYHKTLYDVFEGGIVIAVFHYLFGDAHLLAALLGGIGVVAVYDDGGVFQLGSRVQLRHPHHRLVVEIRHVRPRAVHPSAQDRVGVHVPARTHLIIAVLKYLEALCGKNRIDHRGQISAHGVLHAHRRVYPARHQAVKLIFDASGAHRVIAEQILDVRGVFGIEHLVRAGQAGFPHGGDVQGADTAYPPHDVRLPVRVGLNEHALVTHPLGARLVGVYPRHDDQLFLHPLVELCQAGNVFEHGRGLVRGAGADDHQHLAAPARNDGADFLVPAPLYLPQIFGKGVFRHEFLRFGDIILFFQHGAGSFFIPAARAFSARRRCIFLPLRSRSPRAGRRSGYTSSPPWS